MSRRRKHQRETSTQPSSRGAKSIRIVCSCHGREKHIQTFRIFEPESLSESDPLLPVSGAALVPTKADHPEHIIGDDGNLASSGMRLRCAACRLDVKIGRMEYKLARYFITAGVSNIQLVDIDAIVSSNSPD